MKDSGKILTALLVAAAVQCFMVAFASHANVNRVVVLVPFFGHVALGYYLCASYRHRVKAAKAAAGAVAAPDAGAVAAPAAGAAAAPAAGAAAARQFHPPTRMEILRLILAFGGMILSVADLIRVAFKWSKWTHFFTVWPLTVTGILIVSMMIDIVGDWMG